MKVAELTASINATEAKVTRKKNVEGKQRIFEARVHVMRVIAISCVAFMFCHSHLGTL